MQHFTSFDGLSLAYKDEGTGTPILCLPGLTRNMSDFDYLMPHLDLTRFRVIRPDYRGRGGSDWSGAETYTVPIEARDALALLDHLGVEKAALIGTSRGGIISMMLGATAKDRLSGVCLNDIGPVIEEEGLEKIAYYVGRNPRFKTREEMTAAMPDGMPGFDVPMSRWAEEVERHTREVEDGLSINYDPALRESFEATRTGGAVDLWPLFDALKGLPLALIRGANTDLLTQDTADEMGRRHGAMLFANVPGRGHIPFLDEPEALAVIHAWLDQL